MRSVVRANGPVKTEKEIARLSPTEMATRMARGAEKQRRELVFDELRVLKGGGEKYHRKLGKMATGRFLGHGKQKNYFLWIFLVLSISWARQSLTVCLAIAVSLKLSPHPRHYIAEEWERYDSVTAPPIGYAPEIRPKKHLRDVAVQPRVDNVVSPPQVHDHVVETVHLSFVK